MNEFRYPQFKLKKLFGNAYNFVRAPFVHYEKITPLTEFELNLKLEIYESENKMLSSGNHKIEDGRIRLNVLFDSIANRDFTKPVRISSYCLDSHLYSTKAVMCIKDLLEKDKARILYVKESDSIKNLRKDFRSAFVQIDARKQNDIGRFILSEYAISLEDKQEYSGENLKTHKARFYYNIQSVNAELNPSLSETLKLESKFDELFI